MKQSQRPTDYSNSLQSNHLQKRSHNYHFLHCIILNENPWTFQCYQFVLHYIHTESHCYVSLNYFITKYCTKYQYLLIAFFTQPHPPLWHSHGWTWSNLKFSLPCKYNTKKPKGWFGKKKSKSSRFCNSLNIFITSQATT